jgi:ATP-dependent DNA helicase RecQ
VLVRALPLTVSVRERCCSAAPAVARRGVTIVVSPLLALAHDQLCDLDQRGVCAAQHDSSVESERKAAILAELTDDDDPNTKLLYVTPEGLCKEPMVDALKAANARGLLHAIAVDEAHCVVEWCSFRPECVRLDLT